MSCLKNGPKVGFLGCLCLPAEVENGFRYGGSQTREASQNKVK